MRRVENLALLDAPAPSKTLYPDADYTFWIDKVLQYFTNIRRLTIVDRDHDFRESSDLVWAGDTYIDIEESIKVFNEPGDFNHGMEIRLEGDRHGAALEHLRIQEPYTLQSTATPICQRV
jgi:hypothetical protein